MEKFIQILKAVKRQWKLWGFFPLLSMAAVAYLTRNGEKQYISEATLNFNMETNSDLSLSGQAVKQHEIVIYFQNLIELLKTKRTIEQVRIQVFRDAYNGQHGFVQAERAHPLLYDTVAVQRRIAHLLDNSLPLSLAEPLDSLMNARLILGQFSQEALAGAVSISRIGNSNYIRITVISNNPHKSAYLNQLFMETLVDENRSITRLKVTQDRELYERLVSQSKKVLDEKIKKLEDYKIENSVINLGEHTKAIVNQLVNMEIQLTHAYESQAANQEALNTLKQSFAEGYPLQVNLDNNTEILAAKERIKRLNVQLVQNSFQASGQPAKADSLNKAIEAEKQVLSQLIGGLIKDVPYDLRMTRQDMVSRYIGYQLDLEMAAESVPIIRREIGRLTEYAGKFAPLESNIGTMDREIYTAQEAYLILLNKLNLARTVEEGSAKSEISVIDPPSFPLKAEKSKRMIMVIAAGLGVFVLIIGIVVALELLDNTVKTLKDFEEKSGTKALAIFPNTQVADRSKDPIFKQAIALIYRQQLKALRKILAEQPGGKVVLVTSSFQDEGKWEIANGLLQLSQNSENKALVIYADWSKPLRQLTDEAPVLANGFGQLQPDFGDRSGVVDLSASQESPSDWPTARLRELFEAWANHYPHIYLIVPPISFSADWLEWREFAAYSLYVFRMNRIFHEADTRLLQQLKAGHLHLLGSALTQMNPEFMENFLGEIPKQRSKIRQIGKRILFRNFKKLQKTWIFF